MRKKEDIQKILEYLNTKLPRNDQPYLNINPDTVFSGPIEVERRLDLKEHWVLKLDRYVETGGWRLLGRAHLLKNTCPHCGKQLYLAHQTSPAWTWSHLCGREGYLVYCPHCKKDIQFFLTIMN